MNTMPLKRKLIMAGLLLSVIPLFLTTWLIYADYNRASQVLRLSPGLGGPHLERGASGSSVKALDVHQSIRVLSIIVLFIVIVNILLNLQVALKTSRTHPPAKTQQTRMQTELATQHQRMAQLNHFSDRLAQHKSREGMAGALYQLLLEDPVIDNVTVYFQRELLLASHDYALTLPDGFEQQEEWLVEDAAMTVHYLSLSGEYNLVLSYPTSSSEDWVRNLVAQLQKHMAQIRRVAADPDIELIRTKIEPILADIAYISVEKNYCSVFIERGDELKEAVFRIPLRQLLNHLTPQQITQVSRSTVVNNRKISGFDKSTQSVILQDLHQVPISKKYLSELKKQRPELFSS